MDYGDDYWGLYRDHYQDPFPHSLRRTRQTSVILMQTLNSRIVTLRTPYSQVPLNPKPLNPLNP